MARLRPRPIVPFLAVCMVWLAGCSAPAATTQAPAASTQAPVATAGQQPTAATTAESGTAQLKTVNFGAVSLTAVDWQMYIANDKGFFRDEGLNVDVVYAGSPAAVIQQVVGRSLDIGNAIFETAIRGVEGGAPISIVASGLFKFPYSMVAATDVKSATDLKKVMLGAPKDPNTVFFRRWMKEHGADPSQVDITFDAASPNRYAALQNGSVQATIITQPFDFRAAKEGFQKLADFTGYSDEYAFSSIVARNEWIAQNPDTMRAFLRAEARAVKWLYDPANKDEAVAILDKEVKQDHDLDVQTYDYYMTLKPYLPDLGVPEANVQGVLNTIVEEGDMQTPTPPPSKYLDLAYLPRS